MVIKYLNKIIINIFYCPWHLILDGNYMPFHLPNYKYYVIVSNINFILEIRFNGACCSPNYCYAVHLGVSSYSGN